MDDVTERSFDRLAPCIDVDHGAVIGLLLSWVDLSFSGWWYRDSTTIQCASFVIDAILGEKRCPVLEKWLSSGLSQVHCGRTLDHISKE